MIRNILRPPGLTLAAVLTLLLALPGAGDTGDAPREPVFVASLASLGSSAGARAEVWLHLFNPGPATLTGSFPAHVDGRLVAGSFSATVRLEPVTPLPGVVALGPGAFARHRYAFSVPADVSGPALLGLDPIPTQLLSLEIAPSPVPVSPTPAVERPRSQAMKRFFQEAEPAPSAFNPGQFFRDHIGGHEPFYFLAWTESPNAKFQISFRYQLFSESGYLATNVPALRGLNVAYTQTSLWDLNGPSAPFFDTSYKPELMYRWSQVDRGRWAHWVRLDLQSGLQHESNGKAGADSRSLNIAYLRPTLRLGTDDGFQFKLSPRAWFYVGDLNDNPDLKDYRGYADLRITAGWPRGLQLATTGRIGDDGNHGSAQFDLTYPMMSLLSGSFSVYFHLQYFTGYGETLLLYNDTGSSFRAGFSLYR